MQGFRFMFTFLFRAIPGCLGSLGHFKNKFSDPIEQGQRHSATKRALATGRKAVRALVRKISHWFFRRTKALIKEQLPKKDDRVRLDVRLTNTFITSCPFIIFIITFFFNSIRFIWLNSLLYMYVCVVSSKVVYCSMTEFQQTVYQAVLGSEDVTLLLRSSEKCDCHSRRTRRSCCYKVSFSLLLSCVPAIYEAQLDSICWDQNHFYWIFCLFVYILFYPL